MMTTSVLPGNERGQKFALLLLAFVVVLKMILQYFAIDPSFDLHRDEYLHLDQANHLAWGYQSVPPFTSWVSLLIRWLGNGVFWVKFFPALFGAATIAAAYKITDVLNGGLFAKVLTMAALLFSILFRINILYQPNSFDILCWTLLYLFLIKYITTAQAKWLLWLAVVFAFGFLNKYSIVFLAAAITIALLVTPERKIFTKKALYLYALVALVIITPNLVWQYSNGFPVVHHMKELAETQLVHVQRGDFLKEQCLFFFQALPVLLAAVAGFILYKPFKKYRVIIWSYIFCISLFLYFRAKGYYALGLYPVLISFGAVYLEYLSRHGRKKFLRPVLLILTIALFYPYLIRLPLVSPEKMLYTSPFKDEGPYRWEDGKDYPLSQDFADMRGWRELARKTDSIYYSMPPGERTLVLADNYGQAGAVNYYTKISAVSFNADYVNWFELSVPIKHIIFIKSAESEDQRNGPLGPLFKTAILADSITDQFAREKGTRIYIFKDALRPINELLEKKVKEVAR